MLELLAEVALNLFCNFVCVKLPGNVRNSSLKSACLFISEGLPVIPKEMLTLLNEFQDTELRVISNKNIVKKRLNFVFKGTST